MDRVPVQVERTEMDKKKGCVLFPGIGYTCDKPLLYYGAKIAGQKGYEVIRVPYAGFPPKVKGDRGKMEESFRIALEQSRELLAGVSWEDFGEIVFMGKSVGTIVGGAYAREKGLTVRSLYYTPLEDTFRFHEGEALVLHGTKDPWVATEVIREACDRSGIPLELFEGANHSLETGECRTDLGYLQRAMALTDGFLIG